jgi:hypothetical protein
VLYSGKSQPDLTREALLARLEWMRQIGGTAFFVEQAKRCPSLRFDVDRIHQFTEEELLDGLRLVEAEWNRFLVRSRVFDQKRIRQKMRGRRQPRRADIDALYNRVTDPQGPTAHVRLSSDPRDPGQYAGEDLKARAPIVDSEAESDFAACRRVLDRVFEQVALIPFVKGRPVGPPFARQVCCFPASDSVAGRHRG